MHASIDSLVARIAGAGCVIAAVPSASRLASAAGANIIFSAIVPILARITIRGVDATVGGIATGVGADIAIIATQGKPAHTHASGTGIAAGAGIAVVTGKTVILMGTSGRGITAVRSAEIAVITAERCSADTLGINTSFRTIADASVAAVRIRCASTLRSPQDTLIEDGAKYFSIHAGARPRRGIAALTPGE